MTVGTTDVVVGAGSGLGTAVAKALSGRGRLLLVDRNLEAVESLARALPDAEAVGCDVTDVEQVRSLADRVERLGALVVTAAINGLDIPGTKVLAVGLVGMAQVFSAFERAVGPDTVGIGFSSIAAHFEAPSPEAVLAILDDPLSPTLVDDLRGAGVNIDEPLVGYVLSKHGVMRMVGRLAPSWGARGARILSVSPGMFHTPMAEAVPGGIDAMKVNASGIALGRLGRPEEIGSVVAFLCSPGASYMTGTDVIVGGGAVRWPYGMNLAGGPISFDGR